MDSTLKIGAKEFKSGKKKTATSVSDLNTQPVARVQRAKAPKMNKDESRKRKRCSDSAAMQATSGSPQPNRRLADDMTSETLATTAVFEIIVESLTQLNRNHTSSVNPAQLPVVDTTADDEEVLIAKGEAGAALSAVRGFSTSKRGFKWTKEQDKHLIDAVNTEEEAQQKKKKLGKWERVGERMRQLLPDTLLTGEMCRARWSHYVGPMAQGLKKGESWSKAEVQKLKALIAEHSKVINDATIINWPLICDAEHMNRIPQECRNKWYDLCDDAKEQGPFSEAENALILDSVVRWTHPKRKTGLWVSLGKDLNRPSKRIRDHWRCNLVPKDVQNSDGAK